MASQLALMEPFRWTGEAGRGFYLACGVALFVTKFLIDHFVASLFGRAWTPVDYVAPGLNAGQLLDSGPDRVFYATMIAVSLPFIYIGLALTFRRLRSIGVSRWLLLLFFVPVINVFYFLVLAIIPSSSQRSADERITAQEPIPAARTQIPELGVLDYSDAAHSISPPSAIGRLFPAHPKLSAVVASVAPFPVAVVVTLVTANVLKSYGWGLFLGMPFVVGLLSAYVHGLRVPRRLGQCLGVSMLSLLICGAGLIAFAIEGLGCLIMLLPLAVPVTLMGAFLGYSLQARPGVADLNGALSLQLVLVIALPACGGAERLRSSGQSPIFAVTSAVTIDAPPQRVWENVVHFPPLLPPTELIFRAGIAYPLSARIDGHGTGAIRRCNFSTGTFVEPITVWDEPRRLKFAVIENPPPMREWSPYPHVHPPHLKDFLASEAGEFRLIDLGNGRTRLEGTTWYRHNLWPAAYWGVWSDYLIHRIHLRVLNHVKQLSER